MSADCYERLALEESQQFLVKPGMHLKTIPSVLLDVGIDEPGDDPFAQQRLG
ncbi:MAG TPA: hypothetical protein VN780_14230 [Candidatus Eisenbacteria bacterium]|nr:hypothetical protein [Candidatus Eisenbacteria bacterium]